MHPAFQFHKLTIEGQEKVTLIAGLFDHLLDVLIRADVRGKPLVPEGRHRSVMITKLEEACFFAKKGMAEQNGEPVLERTSIPVSPMDPTRGVEFHTGEDPPRRDLPASVLAQADRPKNETP
ncbi:MAG TPA: hypothetical protein VMK12_05015 [Anaeromyxobacteraceae bacterium]|nr:hypothetical protein [Anaeromyxobacteraceae bacterium]